jgi:hypothetical protein
MGSQTNEVDWELLREVVSLYGATASTSGFHLPCFHDDQESTWRPCTVVDVASGWRRWGDIARHHVLDEEAATGIRIKSRGKGWI